MSYKPLKVGVVGTGNMGRNHLRVLSTMRDYDLIGCYDLNHEMAAQQAEIYGIKAYDTKEELYNDVDVVNIVTPSFLHAECAIEAANAGCNVLVEKPIALKIEDAQAIIDACKNAGVRLCVGHVERFNPAIMTLAGIASQEDIISLSFERMSPFNGRITDADVVEDLMIHDIDVLNSLVTAPIKRIVSQGAKVYTDKADFCQALVAYENGVLASLTASRVTESKVRKATINARNAYIVVDYLNRTVEVSRKTNFKLDVGYALNYTQENIVEKVFVPIAEPLRAEFEHFAHCINTGEPVATSGEMGLKALEMCAKISSGANF